MHQQRAAGMKHIVTDAEVHVLQRAGDIEHAAHVHVDAAALQQSSEHEQVVKKRGQCGDLVIL